MFINIFVESFCNQFVLDDAGTVSFLIHWMDPLTLIVVFPLERYSLTLKNMLLSIIFVMGS